MTLPIMRIIVGLSLSKMQKSRSLTSGFGDWPVHKYIIQPLTIIKRFPVFLRSNCCGNVAALSFRNHRSFRFGNANRRIVAIHILLLAPLSVYYQASGIEDRADGKPGGGRFPG
ncbi:hypothetical protein NPIL_556751 [Nephila pilipes]|uniref:Uncharacterized protein n=1 Tax=Nephila pilipes TaxID=299642 RepID=A0A8X6PZL4_NEPPI|nr:hypothetical protein NPIL_556751 [Nephila pilipes]